MIVKTYEAVEETNDGWVAYNWDGHEATPSYALDNVGLLVVKSYASNYMGPIYMKRSFIDFNFVSDPLPRGRVHKIELILTTVAVEENPLVNIVRMYYKASDYGAIDLLFAILGGGIYGFYKTGVNLFTIQEHIIDITRWSSISDLVRRRTNFSVGICNTYYSEDSINRQIVFESGNSITGRPKLRVTLIPAEAAQSGGAGMRF